MHVYTAGSKIDTNSNIGAGIQSEHFFLYLNLGTVKSTINGEVEAIRVTLQHLNAHPYLFEWAAIFSDSLAAILAIANCCQAPVSAFTHQCTLLWSLNKNSKEHWFYSGSYLTAEYLTMRLQISWPKKVRKHSTEPFRGSLLRIRILNNLFGPEKSILI
ncbi:hypothetical protein TNCV_3806841 [Trichonephila clavipes]|nr:hypothetical protein TNCV_3806841 [Trichonephila clavipes]